MKFAFMSFSTPGQTLPEMLETARKHGYDGIEPRVAADHRHGVELEAGAEKRREIKRVFEDSGIACACVATSLSYCFGDDRARREKIDLSRRYIDLAADIGCDRLRVFGGIPDDRDMETERAVALVGESLAGLAGQASERGVFLCLETHDYLSRADLTAAAVRLAGSPFIRVNWDIMHPFTQGMTIAEAFSEVGDLVGYCHVHDAVYEPLPVPANLEADWRKTFAAWENDTRSGKTKRRIVPMGEGVVPYREALGLLREKNYRGYLSGEYINLQPAEKFLENDIRVLRSYL